MDLHLRDNVALVTAARGLAGQSAWAGREGQSSDLTTTATPLRESTCRRSRRLVKEIRERYGVEALPVPATWPVPPTSSRCST